ncbi:MAG: hypothetical protein IKL10_08150 [Clostridia bacterium]|nr:hypothetical protein [Clostridia bacterium]
MSNINVKFIEEAENCDMNKTKIIKRPLSRLAVAAIIIGCFILSTAAYASVTLVDWEAIISFYDKDGNETQITVSDKAFFKELPDDIPVTEESGPSIPMSKAHAEEILGFSVIGSECSAESIEHYYSTMMNKNSNTVARVDLWCPRFISEGETKDINMLAEILSTEAEDGFIYPFIDGTDAAGGKVYLESYFIETLGVSAVMYTYDDAAYKLNATFVYDDIYYNFTANNYTLDEFKDILNTLK